MSIVLGLNAKFYIDDVSAYTSPVWSEVGNVRDLTLNLERNDTDVTIRANNGWRAKAVVLKDGDLEFEMIWDTSDPNFLQIMNAFLNGTSLNTLALDGPVTTAGNQGLRAVRFVGKFTRKEPLEDALKVDVTMPIAYFPADPPNWMITT